MTRLKDILKQNSDAAVIGILKQANAEKDIIIEDAFESIVKLKNTNLDLSKVVARLAAENQLLEDEISQLQKGELWQTLSSQT